MGSILRICAVLASVVAAAASASAPGRHSVNSTATIPASYDATWNALIDLFAERNWAIQNLDRSSGLITTDWMTIDEKYADCGGSGLATVQGTGVRFNVRVKNDDSRSSDVSVNATFRQTRSFDGRTGVVDCVSNGTVEAFVHRAVDARALSGESKAAKKHERAKKAAAAVPATFYCTSAPADANIAACARSSAGCAKRQTDIVALVGDATPCAEQPGAICFKGISAGSIIESCHPTFTTCEKHLDKTAGDAVMTDLSSCAAP